MVLIKSDSTNKIGCPTWIRTKNNASKGRCVTITPSDKRMKIKLLGADAQSENGLDDPLTKENLPQWLFATTIGMVCNERYFNHI
jgi:hypothetical protein